MRALRIGVSLAAILCASEASANNGGLPGYSGKPTAISPQGESCNQCHSGGTAPTVVINGPATLAAGQSAEYTLVVTTGLVRAGGGVAGSDGVVLTPIAGGGFRDSFGEMVQDAPLTVNGGSATFRFTVKAPSVGTSMKLWGVGLAANNANAQNGDRATHATRDVTITGGGAAPSPDGGGGGTGDGGGGGVIEGAGGPAAEGGTGAGTGTGTGGGNGDGTGDGDGDGENAADPDGNDDGTPSTYGPGRGRSIGGPTTAACAAAPFAIDADGFAAAAGIMVLGAMMMIARRRKRA